jgi:hypothetical protein
MVQVPVAGKVATAPLTVQTSGVSEAKLTGSPELAVTASVTVTPMAWLGTALNVIVCSDCCLEEMTPLQPLSMSVMKTKSDKELLNERNGFIASAPEYSFPGDEDAAICN